MDEVIYIPTLIVSGGFLAVYIYSCLKNKVTVEISALVNSILNASGVAGGGFLMLSTLMPSLKEKLSNLNLYIFIAGLVVLVVSIQAMYREINKN
jgi:uncharacterized membrane protein